MKRIILVSILLLCTRISKAQNINLSNATDYIRVQKAGETDYTRAFGLNGSNHLYIGSVEKTIGNIYFFNKGTDHLMTLNPNGNLGIGTTNPGSRLDILSNTALNQTESFMRFKVSDAPSDYLQIFNITGVSNRFLPAIKGNVQSANISSLIFIGSTDATNDNSSDNSIMRFDTRRSTNDQGITNRSLFQWTNFDQKLMTMSANGNLGIGTISPTSKLEVRGGIKTSYDNNRSITLFTAGDGNAYMNMTGGTANSRFGFQVDGSSKMSLMQNGNLGIGTVNPDVNLHVSKSNGQGNAPIIAGNVATFQSNSAPGYYTSANIISGTEGRASFFFGDKDGGAMGGIRYNNSDNSLSFRTNGGDDKLLITASGNVGIGSTNPDAKLRVQGLHSLARFKTDIDGRFEIQATRSTSNSNITDLVLSSQNHIVLDPNVSGTNGNVGIGTYTPDAKLAVNGTIHSKEVKVDLVGWPDYVFEPEYNLPTLQEVEQHINEKGHLQNIPSAAEVEKEGVQLGEMNAKLLQKIEELTLYMIEQNKKTAQLQKEVEQLKKKNAELEQRIK
ncbi:TMF family protein [Aquimarina brevivitae]|uniref:Endosialidase-like protein n=1 Tax=Aquimarina brevivitae TaxID=323412 RepID=A0A4Q7PIT4_9FLAO|nr:TMF family protein [Aquimarina brevivitae]RZT00336.1 hypothetical protein EV197_1572 [Aquimarina brevivitae]